MRLDEKMNLAGAPPDLFVTNELAARRSETTDYKRVTLAVQELASRMVECPEEVLPRFVELSMKLSGAVSAGLSLIEAFPEPGVFRWRYLHGKLASFENSTAPRHDSPCGFTLEVKGPVLTVHPERFYTWIAAANLVVPEVLLVPLYLHGCEPIGTLWIVSDEEGRFTQEDAHVATELASFVGLALQMVRTKSRLEAALAQQTTLAEEMGHRVKNLFALSEALVKLTAKAARSKEELEELLLGRFHTLADAHALVRGARGDEDAHPNVAHLGAIVRAVVSPHESLAGASRFWIHGPLLRCGNLAVNGIALIFHELTTNAAKYGALTVEQGRVEVRWVEQGGELVCHWIERGGPAIMSAPREAGLEPGC
jgi:two-component sensor histidine kinase